MTRDTLRHEVAAAAAIHIADGGLDYQSAKRKALRQMGQEASLRALPDNDLVDQYLLEHLTLFDPAHPGRVEQWRRIAVQWMQRLAAFDPYLTGAAWKGIVAAHAPVHLQVFTDLGKELEMSLLDDRIDFDVDEIEHFAGRGHVPLLQFMSGDVPVMISVYDTDDLRGALRRAGRGATAERPARGDLAGVRALLDANR